MPIRRDNDAIEGALIMSRYINGNEAEVEALAKNREAEMECLRAIDPVAAAKAERAFVGDVELVGIIGHAFCAVVGIEGDVSEVDEETMQVLDREADKAAERYFTSSSAVIDQSFEAMVEAFAESCAA